MKMKETFQTVAAVMPTKEEVGQELGNRVTEAKGFVGKVITDVGAELLEQLKHGSHEVAAALFKGTEGFVMYPHEGKQPEQDPPQHGLPPEAQVEKHKEVDFEMER